MKDWIGNGNSIFKSLGASNHTDKERQSEDFYATDPKAAELLLEVEKFSPKIWECACGQGHLSKVFEKHGYQVRSTDLVDRGYGEQKDFLFFNDEEWEGDIITNPPYKFATEFIYRALEVIRGGTRLLCSSNCSSWKVRRDANSMMNTRRRWYMFSPKGSTAL